MLASVGVICVGELPMSVESTVEFELPGATLRFRFSGHSDRGAVRRVNEDSFLVAPPLFALRHDTHGRRVRRHRPEQQLPLDAEGLWSWASSCCTSSTGDTLEPWISVDFSFVAATRPSFPGPLVAASAR